ncbi:MAG TPA: polysaccharide biosynthesis/export family protein [Candidatus Acidoferrales bacterium]|nr:polysaccharide biosynthesis/export family protein [Candidatus Acidoferrales bacterium]
MKPEERAELSAVRRAWRQRWPARVLLAFSLLLMCRSALAQNMQSPKALPSDLARQNMDRVAASAEQIAIVLHQNAGLMVELKRWVAKDATGHGQLISDADLTDRAIYSRLETDLEFRSTATALLQKFGYLLPQVNPASPQAKEQQAVVEERVRWLAQNERERLTSARQTRIIGGTQQDQVCDPALSIDCNTPPSNYAAEQPEELGAPPVPQTGSPSGNPSVPTTSRPSLPTLEKAQLLEEGTDAGSQASVLAPESGCGLMLPGISDLSLAGPGTLASSNAGNKSAAQPWGIEGLPAVADVSNEEGSGAERPAEVVSKEVRPPILHDRPIMSQLMLRQPDPYADIPSLYDMYLQATPQPTTPERFGMEVFENGTRDTQTIPFDLPVGPDYVVGPGDSLAIDLWGGVSQRLFLTVDKEGRVSLPQVGPLLVAGKSLAQAQESVQETLRSQFRDVSASVSLSRLRFHQLR